ncbi:hypothetical protein QBC47DRAFT_397166 [Echria macrotheca]|uniref:Uncharacterized protein n=1 Tax=Echria macrotheca TaxID=438768 RepID=A0AAJ0BPV0_9PEZI|nr:hypothetical protein QBC47DRAFT_397166 [Echria macrotheca]
MPVICCCRIPRFPKPRSLLAKDAIRSASTPRDRPPGPLTLNPVTPASTEFASVRYPSPSSVNSSIPTGIAPMDAVELGQLVVEDSDTDDDIENRTPRSKSPGTLQLVRARVRRHLSQDSLPRRKSRSAVGSSRTEIERRAELKRLMHKRIQEELRSEESPDTTGSDITSSIPQPIQSMDLLPGGGPRDNIEFQVAEDTKREPQCMCHVQPGDAPFPLALDRISKSDRASSPEPRRVSCPDPIPKPASQSIVRERSSLPHLPPSPEILPRGSRSTHETSSIGSWRLFFSSGQLDELLGYTDHGRHPSDDPSTQRLPLGPTSAFPVSPSRETQSQCHAHAAPARQATPANEQLDLPDQSPLSTWLRSQGLASKSPPIPGLRVSSEDDPDGTIEEAEVVYLRRCSSVQKRPVQQAEQSRSESVHLFDMDIPRQLATHAFTPEGSGNGSTQNISNGGPISGDTQIEKQDVGDGAFEGSRKDQLSTSEPPSSREVTGPSSVYPSTANSAEPSPGASSHQVPDWSMNHGRRPSYTTSSYNWIGNSGNPFTATLSGGSSRPTVEEAPLNEPRPDSFTRTRPDQPVTDSTPFGRTTRDPSFDQAERRLGRFRLGSGAPATFITKFQKRADDSEPQKKPSMFARFQSPRPGRPSPPSESFDGASQSDEDEITPSLSPKYVFGSNIGQEPSETNKETVPSPCRVPTPGILKDEEITAELWKKAFREDARLRKESVTKYDSRNRRSSYPNHPCKTQPGQDSVLGPNKSSLAVYHTNCANNSEEVSPVSTASGRFTPSPLTMSHHEDKASTVVDQSPILPFAYSSGASPGPHERASRGTPVSWASFPSYNRMERNNAASDGGHLSKASREVAEEGAHQSLHHVDQNAPQHAHREAHQHVHEKVKATHRSSNGKSKSLPGRFRKAFKHGLNKLIPSKFSPNRDSKKPKEPTDRYKRKLEYPELEIPPTAAGAEELKLLEHEIGHMKGLPCGNLPPTVRNPEGTNADLGNKMARILSTDGAGGSYRPETPAPSYALDSTTASTERYTTPVSFMSTNHDNLSFHSYLRSRPPSGSMVRFSEAVEVASIVSLTREEAGLGRKLRSATVSEVDSGFGGSTTGASKAETWSGRSRTLPHLSTERLERIDGIEWRREPSGAGMRNEGASI